jgi:hypothetical protein
MRTYVDNGTGITVSVAENETVMVFIRINSSYVGGVNFTVNPMLNRGSTTIPYTPYFRNTLPIPEAARKNLDGYGWGINADCYNYIDFEKKQFVKRVEYVDLGSLSWINQTTGSGGVRFLGFTTKNPVPSLSKEIPNIVCIKYKAVSTTDTWNDIEGITTRTNGIEVKDHSYTDAEIFKNAMAGVIAYYELADPIITDISDLLSADNFIGVEEGGTVTFKNEYEYNVPSEVTYQIKGAIV